MNKAFVLVLCGFLHFGVAQADPLPSQIKWSQYYKFERTENAPPAVFYFAKSSIKRDSKGIVYVPVLSDTPESSCKYIGSSTSMYCYKSSIEEFEIDCKFKTLNTSTEYFFAENMGAGGLVYKKEWQTDWRQIYKGSHPDLLATIVCKK